MNKIKDKILLERIFESIETIEGHLVNYSWESFNDDKKTYDAVLMQIVNIGEMVNRLSNEFREKHHDFPWHEIIGMRNQIAHGYFKIKAEEIWETAISDVPDLKKQIDQILNNN